MILTVPPDYLSDIVLSRRLELTEAQAARSFVDARSRFEPGCGAQWFELAGATVLYDGPNSPATQTFGVGLSRLPNPDELQHIEDFFAAYDAAVHHEISPMVDPAILPLLSGRGYHPCELTTVMFQPLAGREPGPIPVPVRRAERIEFDTWARTAAEGWKEAAGMDDGLEPLMRIIGGAAGCAAYFAEIDGVPVATGAMYLHNGVAMLAGAATLSQWRQRGAQRSLVEYRLACAAEAGCDLAMMCAAPGSSSQRNAQRHGFRIAYTRIKWRKLPPH